MALLDFGSALLPKRGAIRYLFIHLHTALYAIPADMASLDPTSGTVALPWYLSNGSRNDHQYDSLCLRSCVGLQSNSIGILSQSMGLELPLITTLSRHGLCGGSTS